MEQAITSAIKTSVASSWHYISHINDDARSKSHQICVLVLMQSARHSCPILMKLEISRQIFEKKNSNVSFTKIRPVGAEL